VADHSGDAKVGEDVEVVSWAEPAVSVVVAVLHSATQILRALERHELARHDLTPTQSHSPHSKNPSNKRTHGPAITITEQAPNPIIELQL
jgi:hypothetical protein